MLIEGFVAQHFVEDIKCRAWRYIKRIIIAGTVFCSHRHLTVLTAVFPPEKKHDNAEKSEIHGELTKRERNKTKQRPKHFYQHGAFALGEAFIL